MEVWEAANDWLHAQAIMQDIAQHYPCPKCHGKGELYPGGCWHPCEECRGRGFVIPEEGDQ